MTSILTEIVKGTEESKIIELVGKEDALVNEVGHKGHSTLHTAINHYYFKLALEMVLDPRVNMNTVTAWGSSPLSCALHHRKWDLAKIMLCVRPEMNVNMINARLFTPLHMACEFGAHEIVKLILERPDCNVNTVDGSGTSPLMDACIKWPKYGDETIKALVARPELDPNVSNVDGVTAFTLAASKSQGIRLFELLLCNRNSRVNFNVVDTLFMDGEELDALASLTPFDKQGPRLRLKYGFAYKEAKDLFLLILSGKTVRKGEKSLALFMNVARRLPPELQMRLCNLNYAINEDFIKIEE